MFKKGLSVLLVVIMMFGVIGNITVSVTAQEAEIAEIGWDDYPYSGGAIDVADEWNMLTRECTSFCAWRLNNTNGVAFHNYYGGVHWGNAGNWGYAAQQIDIAVDMNPKVGSIAWWSSGHVAWVAEVNGDSVYIEEYNSPAYSYNYNDRTINRWSPSGYIHIKDLDGNPFPYTPINLGEDFCAQIKNLETGYVLSKDNYISNAAFDVKAKPQNGSRGQFWHFIRIDDGSYAIKNLENDWCLDVEAGYNLNNLSAQPDGTNIQIYNTYSGTDNQRFFIYNIFDSYYIKPVGTTNKMVDMSLSGGNIAIYGFGENFAPQRFIIVKSDLKGNSPVNIGTDFYAQIKNLEKAWVLTKDNSISNSAFDVKAKKQNGGLNQLWHFTRLGDDSYVIRNAENNWCLDVEAGYHLNNINEQPNGTNIQLYSSYNGNDNQRFYIYSMFDSYYIKPVGADKIVDMSLSDGKIAMYGYGENFAPQRFTIVKSELKGNRLADIGTDFYAKIKNKEKGWVFSKGDNISTAAFNVKAEPEDNGKDQLWHFTKLGDGSYVIRNYENKWCLDVDAGYYLNNINEQPNGTNIQIYNTYNSTDNQRFYIYNMFDSYYIKPVGAEKIVDMSLSNGNIAMYGYGENFAPQKFDIIKTTPNNNILGDVDGDEVVTILDATAIQRHLASIPTESYNEQAADADEDGTVTIIDATAIQRYLAKLKTNENIGKPMT